MWIYISTIAKTIIFSTQTEVQYFTSHFSAKPSTIIVGKHRQFAKFVILHNRIQIGEKILTYYLKNWHSLKCHSNCATYKAQIAHTTNYQKQQLTAHTSIVKRYTAKFYKHAPFSSKRTIVVTGVRNSTNISAQIQNK